MGNNVYVLGPKSIFAMALFKTHILNGEHWVKFIDDVDVVNAFDILEMRMKQEGLISERKAESTTEQKGDAKTIFKTTVKGFFPEATDEQAETAYYTFAFEMKKTGQA